jgi:ATP-dependent DNA helicase RecG
VEQGWLERSGGHGRGTRYRWPTEGIGDLFERGLDEGPGSEHSESEQSEKLLALAAPVREKARVPKELVEETVLSLCSENRLTLRTLANLLRRDTDSLRNHYINPMLRDGRLVAVVPGMPNHPTQAYKKKPE